MNYNILDSIGNTPLVKIRHLNPNPNVKILAKLEYLNPGGSIKDRAALFMINAAEKSGELTPAKTVIEATSGNTGIGLALVCAVKGYRLLLTMSEAVSIERRKILQARGAEILLTPGHLGTDGAIEEAYRLARENPELYFMTDQFNNPANWQAHYHGTAREVWDQTEGKLTKLVAAMGTTGTLMGMQRRLKELNPAIEIIGVEPYLGHKIQGLKNMKEAYCPEIFEKDRLDKKVNIDDEDAYETARQLADKEGLLVGMSSGAAMFVAMNESKNMQAGTIVVILPDGGERYLSTPLFTVKEKVGLKLYNTLGRAKEAFIPQVSGKVTMFSSGPTMHARMHPAECRRMIFADLLSRYLEFRGYSVTHVMNVTDLDDKTIAGSEKEGTDLKTFTDRFVASFRKDLVFLGIKPAAKYPRTSEHLEDMTALAEKLVGRGFAYEKLRSLYFNIARLSDYGKLSGVDIDKIKIGATVDLDSYEKDNPRDFTLLKRSRLSELKRGIYTKTQWGNVRPSWHLQCAAIALKHLGGNYDIHTSGRELLFPHNENEIAISAALTGKPPARYWIHCDRVLLEGKKINDTDRGLSLDDLKGMGFSGREIRCWLLTTHYRKPITFSKGRLEESRRSLKRLDACITSLRSTQSRTPYPEIDQLVYDIKNDFIRAMDDDLNISAAMASLFKKVKKINSLLTEKKIDGADTLKVIAAFKKIDAVLQLFDFEDPGSDPEVAALIREREAARKVKNWPLADRIRDQLRSRGISVSDPKGGKA